MGSKRTAPSMDQVSPSAHSIPSLDVDYDELDAEDPHCDITWFQNLAVFGFAEHHPSDPRYKALSKLKQLTKDHGIEDLRFIDYYRALLVFAALSDKKEKAKAKARRAAADSAAKAVATAPAAATKSRFWSKCENSGNAPKSPVSSAWNMTRSTPLRRWMSWPQRKRAQSALRTRAASEPAGSVAAGHSSSGDGDDALVTANHTASEPTHSVTSDNSDDNSVSADAEHASVTADHVCLLYHMLRHAESIYGFPITIASAPMTSIRKMSGIGITTSRNDIPVSDVVHTHFSATTFTPAHYVAVDRNIEAVVVCVRGTANIFDSLTDITATHDPLHVRRHDGGADDIVKGYGHSGVLRSARNLFDLIRESTLSALRANKGYELLLTGHSLGAAIAAVLSLIMRDDAEFPHALAVCIAPPPCLSWALAQETVTTAVTLVNGPDIVPRLSVPVLLPYLATARYVADMPQARRALVALGLHSVAVEWDDLREECEQRAEAMRENHRGKELFIPGAVFQLVRMNEVHRRDAFRNTILGTKEVRLVPVHRNDFVGVRGRERGMFFGHAPSSYRNALSAVLRSMGVSKWRKGSNTGRVFRALTKIPIGDYSGVEVVEGESKSSDRTRSRYRVDKIVKALYIDGLKQRQPGAQRQTQ